MSYGPTSPVFAKPRVSRPAFVTFLGRKGFPAPSEAAAIYSDLVAAGVDPALALGQLAAESSYGLKGYARTTRNWGNIVIGHPRVPHWTRAFGGAPWLAPNGRTYAKFPTWRAGAKAYAALLRSYKLWGWAKTVSGMAGRWLGMKDASRSGYVRTILNVANTVPVTVVPAPIPAPKPAPPPGAIVPPPAAQPTPQPLPSKPAIPVTPTDATAEQANMSALVDQDIYALASGGNGFVFRRVGAPAGQPVAALVHGGPAEYGAGNYLTLMAHALAAAGFVSYLVDYHSDMSGLADLKANIAQVRARESGKLVIVGHSFGGFVGSITALQGSGDAFVSLAGVLSHAYANYITGNVFLTAPAPETLAVRRPTMPVSVVAAIGDDRVPNATQEPFVIAANKAGHPGVNVLVSGSDHSGVLTTKAAVDAIVATVALI